MKKIEELIFDKNFEHEEPWFYNNNQAIRCELGIGNNKKYIHNAITRAKKIYYINGKRAIKI